MREHWADSRYRAMVTEAIRRAKGLPAMTEEQRRQYEKLRKAGASRDAALAVVLKA